MQPGCPAAVHCAGRMRYPGGLDTSQYKCSPSQCPFCCPPVDVLGRVCTKGCTRSGVEQFDSRYGLHTPVASRSVWMIEKHHTYFEPSR